MKLMNGKMVEGMDNTIDPTSAICEACFMGKQHRCPYPQGGTGRAAEPFEVFYSDVCAPMSVSSLGGSGYYATFIDDYTRHTSVYFMKTKYEVLEKIKEFYNSAVNFTGKQVKVLRTDNVENTAPKRFMHSERERNYSPVNCSLQSCSKWSRREDESHNC